MPEQTTDQQPAFEERVINIDRVARVVKGGRRFRFRAVVAVGDRKGRVGMGVSKGADVSTAITKAADQAKKNLVTVPLYKHGTIPHRVEAKHGGARLMMKPAGPGTGVIAGGAVREILEIAGITDILSKSFGSSNKVNTSYATFTAFSQLKDLDSDSDTPSETGKQTSKPAASEAQA